MKFLILSVLLFSASTFAAAPGAIYKPEGALSGTHVQLVYDINEDGLVRNIRVPQSNATYAVTNSVKQQMYNWRLDKNSPRKNQSLDITFGD